MVSPKAVVGVFACVAVAAGIVTAVDHYLVPNATGYESQNSDYFVSVRRSGLELDVAVWDRPLPWETGQLVASAHFRAGVVDEADLQDFIRTILDTETLPPGFFTGAHSCLVSTNERTMSAEATEQNGEFLVRDGGYQFNIATREEAERIVGGRCNGDTELPAVLRLERNS